VTLAGHSGYPKISGRIFRVSGFQKCYPKLAGEKKNPKIRVRVYPNYPIFQKSRSPRSEEAEVAARQSKPRSPRPGGKERARRRATLAAGEAGRRGLASRCLGLGGCKLGTCVGAVALLGDAARRALPVAVAWWAAGAGVGRWPVGGDAEAGVSSRLGAAAVGVW